MLSEKTAVVTGAASGNGREIARQFAREGADVVVADIREVPREDGTPTHELIREETDSDVTFVECDVASRSDIEDSVGAADAFGGIDIMVNNAGVFRSEEFLEVSEEAYDRMMDINVKGVFFGAQVAGERFVEQGSGSIINLSSSAGLEGAGPHVTYCTSKGAVRLMTYALADALGPAGVRVNSLHPGAIDTQMLTDDVPIVGSEEGEMLKQTIPSRRFGTPADVAGAALFLASDHSEYVNGASLPVDGGLTNTS